MLRRSKWLALVLLLSGVAACLGVVAFLAKREPAFYTKTPCPVDWDTRERASKLLTRVQDLKNDIRSKPEWGDTFAADDLNCFFVESMAADGALRSLFPEKVHTPRVAVEGDRLRIGFRYGSGFWSAVVSVELRVWLVADEVNLVGVEVCDLRTGGLPVGSQSVLDTIAESARDSNIDVTWYQNSGNPVGLFRFFADQPQPASQIQTLEVKDGTIVVVGRSTRSATGPTADGPRVPGE